MYQIHTKNKQIVQNKIKRVVIKSLKYHFFQNSKNLNFYQQ